MKRFSGQRMYTRRRQAFVGAEIDMTGSRLPAAPAGVTVRGVILFSGYTALGKSGVAD